MTAETNMNGTVPPAAEDGVYALLALLANPKDYKAALDALTKAKTDAQAAKDAADKAVADAVSERAAAEQIKADTLAALQAEGSVNAANADRNTRTAAALADQQANLLERIAAFNAESAAWTAQKASESEALDAREAAIAEQEATADENLQVGSDLRKTYEAKMASLKALAG